MKKAIEDCEWCVVQNYGAYVNDEELATLRIDTHPDSGRDVAVALVITDMKELQNKKLANIIAAAPLMLKALRAVLSSPIHGNEPSDAAVELASSALLAAEGRETDAN